LEGVSKWFQIEMGVSVLLFLLGIFLDLGAGLCGHFTATLHWERDLWGWSAGAAEVVIVLFLVGTLVAVIHSSNFYSFQTD
jgi:hypothetical protein